MNPSKFLEPANLAFAGINQVIGGISQFKSGQLQEQLYNYNAEKILESGKAEQESAEAEYARLMGRQRSLYAMAGVDIASGSPLLAMTMTAMEKEKSLFDIRKKAEAEANIQRFYGRMARRKGTTTGLASIFKGIGNTAAGYYKLLNNNNNANED